MLQLRAASNQPSRECRCVRSCLIPAASPPCLAEVAKTNTVLCPANHEVRLVAGGNWSCILALKFARGKLRYDYACHLWRLLLAGHAPQACEKFDSGNNIQTVFQHSAASRFLMYLTNAAFQQQQTDKKGAVGGGEGGEGGARAPMLPNLPSADPAEAIPRSQFCIGRASSKQMPLSDTHEM